MEGNGRGGGIRTRDPLRPRQVRYQAALRPDYQLFYCNLFNSRPPIYPGCGAKHFKIAAFSAGGHFVCLSICGHIEGR